MFTFSFGSAMATTYTLDDYATALTAEKTAQLGYINSVKTQYVNSLTYDDDGFATVNGTKYMKAALEAAANEVIADADKAMKAAIDNRLNNFEDTTTAPDKTVVSNVASAYNTVAVFGPLVEAKTETLNKTQAPLTKKFVQEKVTVDLSKYNSTDPAVCSSALLENWLTALKSQRHSMFRNLWTMLTMQLLLQIKNLQMLQK